MNIMVMASQDGCATSSSRDFRHTTVDHAKGQFVVGAIHTQTIEGFCSIFKRGAA